MKCGRYRLQEMETTVSYRRNENEFIPFLFQLKSQFTRLPQKYPSSRDLITIELLRIPMRFHSSNEIMQRDPVIAFLRYELYYQQNR